MEKGSGGGRGPEPNGRGASSRGAEARPRNWLVPVILVTLRELNSYGYDLMERTATFGFGTVNPGTLYRTLRRMENEGLCESRWETSEGGPARRTYAITDAGEAYLDLWARSFEQYRRAMETIFALYTGRPARSGKENARDE